MVEGNVNLHDPLVGDLVERCLDDFVQIASDAADLQLKRHRRRNSKRHKRMRRWGGHASLTAGERGGERKRAGESGEATANPQ